MALGSVQTILLKGHDQHVPGIQGSQNQPVLGIEVTCIVFVCLGTGSHFVSQSCLALSM